MENKRKRIFGIITLVAVIAAVVVVCILFGRPLLEFVGDTESFRAWVDENAPLSHIVFVGMVVFQVIVAVIPGEPFELAAGYVFGIFEGILLYTLGVVIGSALILLVVKRYGMRVLRIFFSDAKIDSLRYLLRTKRAAAAVFLLMLIPGTPKDLVTYFMGLTDIKPLVCLAICGLARLPSTVTSVIGGSAIGTKDYAVAVVVLVCAALISIVGVIARKKYTKRHTECKKEDCRS